ncbi:MAG: acetylornithine deacetylase [Pseudomonadota bacterium]
MKNTLEILSRLIAFDTTSRYSNLELIQWVADYLHERNVDSVLTYDGAGEKANLFATIGSSDTPGYVLSGHTDVVPVDGQQWTTDPFKAEVRDEKLYGRGACDMKGFIAVCLAQLDNIVAAGLDTPIHFAFSYDEEVGCVGVNGLLADLKARGISPKGCIIGEPTSMQIVRAHKGMFFQRCCVHGKSAHSSLVHHGVNAVTQAAKAIHFIDDMACEIQREGPFDHEFDPPYTTLHCGVVNGGTANNIIPNRCEFDFEIRNLPQHNPLPLFEQIRHYTDRQLQPVMQAVDPSCGFEWTELARFPGMDTDSDAPLVTMVADLLGQDQAPGKVSYGTEGGLFQQSGVETLICGPGSIEQAHKPDEYVALSQLQNCFQFLTALLQSLSDSQGT